MQKGKTDRNREDPVNPLFHCAGIFFDFLFPCAIFLRGAPDSCHCGIWTGFFGQPGIYRQITWGCGAFQCDQFFADYDQRGAAYPCTDCGAVGKGIRRLKYNGNLMLVITNNYIITMKNRRYDTMIYRK